MIAGTGKVLPYIGRRWPCPPDDPGLAASVQRTGRPLRIVTAQVRSAISRPGTLTLSISDGGIGGADPSRGSGLIGLKDRVAALGGTISVLSPPGAGAALHVRLPADPVTAPTRGGTP